MKPAILTSGQKKEKEPATLEESVTNIARRSLENDEKIRGSVKLTNQNLAKTSKELSDQIAGLREEIEKRDAVALTKADLDAWELKNGSKTSGIPLTSPFIRGSLYRPLEQCWN